jgi:thioredoxin-related protein
MPASNQRDALVGRIAVVVTLLTGLVVTATALALAFPVLGERFRARPAAVAYFSGDVIDVDPSTYSSASRTVFFFSRYSCGGCQASKNVMASIARDIKQRAGAHVVLVTARTFPVEERSFALELGIDPASVYQTDLQKLRVRLVPTMVLTDTSGKILMAREGLITENDRAEIVRLVNPSGTPGP